jgi:hypothetical protein
MWRLTELTDEQGTDLPELIQESQAYRDTTYFEDRSPNLFGLYQLVCPRSRRLFLGAQIEGRFRSVGGLVQVPLSAPANDTPVFWLNDFYVERRFQNLPLFAETVRGLSDWLKKEDFRRPLLYGVEHRPYSFQRLQSLLDQVGMKIRFPGLTHLHAVHLRPRPPAAEFKSATPIRALSETALAEFLEAADQNRNFGLRLKMEPSDLRQLALADPEACLWASRSQDRIRAGFVSVDLGSVKRYRGADGTVYRSTHAALPFAEDGAQADLENLFRQLLEREAGRGRDFVVIRGSGFPVDSGLGRDIAFPRRSFSFTSMATFPNTKSPPSRKTFNRISSSHEKSDLRRPQHRSGLGPAQSARADFSREERAHRKYFGFDAGLGTLPRVIRRRSFDQPDGIGFRFP